MNHVTEGQFDKWLATQGIDPNSCSYPMHIFIGNDGKMYCGINVVMKHQDGSPLGPMQAPGQPFVETKFVPLPELFTLEEINTDVAGVESPPQ